MLLAEGEVKDKIMEWIVSVAAFSGIEVWAFCIMDNHLHLFVHVPPVPERLWLDPDDEPAAYAFGMRPPAGRSVPLRQLDDHKRRASPPLAEHCRKRLFTALVGRCTLSSTHKAISKGGLVPTIFRAWLMRFA